jgi:hypothetical protein
MEYRMHFLVMVMQCHWLAECSFSDDVKCVCANFYSDDAVNPLYEVCKRSHRICKCYCADVLTWQFQDAQAAHRKAEGLKIRKRIFRPSALDNFDCW